MPDPSDTSSLWSRINLTEGDITKFQGDAIVNAANSSLLGGGGVDGAIHRAAGRQLLEECRTLGGCPCGEARLTGGYKLPAGRVIHTVGPVYGDGRSGEPELLTACYRSSLELAVAHAIRTLAFPAVSCGVYGYPIEAAARIALSTTADFLGDHHGIDKVVFYLFAPQDCASYQAIYDELAGAG